MAEGPFDKYLSPWDKIRRSDNVDDRRDDPWPWHKIEGKEGSPTHEQYIENIVAAIKKGDPYIPAMTALSRDAGARDISPIPAEELIKFLINIDQMNPDRNPVVATPGNFDPVTGRTYPLPRPDPRKRK